MQDSDMQDSDSIPYGVGIDRELCQTAAICLAFDMYELDDESKAVLLTNNGSTSDSLGNTQASKDGFVRISDLLNKEGRELETIQKDILESAKLCPFNAIIVRDETGQQIWP